MILGVYIITQLLGMAVKISSELLRSSVIFQPPYPITIIYVDCYRITSPDPIFGSACFSAGLSGTSRERIYYRK